MEAAVTLTESVAFFWQLALGVSLFPVFLLSSLLYLSPKPRLPSTEELEYKDALTGRKNQFPRLIEHKTSDTTTSPSKKPTGSPSVTLSVVVPAYNEEERLPVMMKETLAFLETKCTNDETFSYEVIIVDDGSKDSTTTVAYGIAKSHLKNVGGRENGRRDIRVMTLRKNRGKGGAVAQGVLASRGDYVLFVDADGATRFSDLETLLTELKKVEKDGQGIAIGSRAHMVKSEAVVKRSLVRNILMKGFHFLVYIFGVKSIKDTQCGFKLFTRKTAHTIFSNLHIERWIFDIEVLLIGMSLRVPMVEVPVNWHEVDGTKLSILTDSVQMLVQLIMIRVNYFTGVWKVKKLKEIKKD